jgi:hypothetical protein
MKAIILTAAVLMISFIGKSQNQFIKKIENKKYVEREWYQIEGEDFEGVNYITSSDIWILQHLEEFLKKDGISIKKPNIKQVKKGIIVFMAWEYKQSDGRTIFVSYVYNSMNNCDMSFEYID